MSRSYRGWLIAIALVGATVDQASKYVVFGWLHNHPTRYNQLTGTGAFEIVPHAFSLHVQYTNEHPTNWLQTWSSPHELPRVNQGALFGLGHEHAVAANYFFAAVSIIAGLAIIGFSFRPGTSRDRWLCLSLGLILAGTMGNLYDRIVFQGVRDFLYYYYLVNWPVFNIADCCLVCGAFVLLAQAFLTSPAAKPAPQPVSEPVAKSVSIPAGEIIKMK
jgi:lipoprotein signal peptidase